MKVLATHITRYWYSDPVSTCHNEVHLAPRPRANQILLDYNLTVNPQPDSVASREDYFGNEVSSFSIHEPHRELIVTAHSRAELTSLSPPHLDLSPPWEQVRQEAEARKTAATFEAGAIRVRVSADSNRAAICGVCPASFSRAADFWTA